MKSIFASLSLGLVIVGSPVLARGGDDDSVLTRGSQAWFAAESGEHELRALLADGALTDAQPLSLVVDLTSTTTSEVSLETATGTWNDDCRMEDHWSRRGTVLKKEVFCNASPYYAPRVEPTRGSNAWALVEGIEHSLRLAVQADAAVKEAVSFAEADLDGDAKVQVKIGLSSGAELSFLCLRTMTSRGGTRADLICSAL